MRKTIRIRSHELGLWFRHGELHRVLEPGVLRVWGLGYRKRRDDVQVIDTLRPRFEHDMLKVLAQDERLAHRLVVVDLKDDERALVWVDGRLHVILPKGLHAFWNQTREVEIETYNINDARFDHPKMESILTLPGAVQLLNGVRVESHERVMLFRDGQLIDRLGAGHYVYWRGGKAVTWKSVDLREQIADVQGQEIMTADKVTLRVNLVATYRVTDPVKAVTEVVDYAQALYRETQLELRAAVGGRTLEKLLADKDELGAEIRNGLASKAESFGVSVSGVGLRDVILPGDMKAILNEVILAQKQAEANLIRRREETAAARSQANTAKLLAEQPVLARMKELEALQDILKGSKATFVLGSGDIAEQVGSLIRRDAERSDA